MTLQLESIYRQKTTKKLQILTMYEHPENDQGQQLRGRRGVRMHGSAQRQNRGRGRRRRGQKHIADEIMLSFMALQWLKGAAKNWEIDHILNNSNILKQSLSINIPHTLMCKFVLLKGNMTYITSAAFWISVQ